MIDRRKLLLAAGPAALVAPASTAMGIPMALTPQERIDAAMAEIRAALAEMYPGCHVTSRMGLRDGSGGVALGAYPLKGYEVRYFFCDDPEGWSPAVPYSAHVD